MLGARSILAEPSTTYAVTSAMMKLTVPFYIAINSAVEILFLPLVLFVNRTAEVDRRWIVIAAAMLYVVQRVWTYLVYAGRRLATGTSTLSQADVQWYRRTLGADCRTVLNAITFLLFAAAALLPFAPDS